MLMQQRPGNVPGLGHAVATIFASQLLRRHTVDLSHAQQNVIYGHGWDFGSRGCWRMRGPAVVWGVIVVGIGLGLGSGVGWGASPGRLRAKQKVMRRPFRPDA